MNVASLELCKELYELSGWDGTDEWYAQLSQGKYAVTQWDIATQHNNIAKAIPAYDLGYLLRKLAEWNGALRMSFDYAGGKYWHFDLNDIETLPYAKADTPEDAACKLAVELFKQGVLK